MEAKPAEPWRQLGRKVEKVGSSIQHLATPESVAELREALAISRRMETNPYGMLAAAVGVGFILGGGLFSAVARRTLGAGLKLALQFAALPLLEQQLSSLITGARAPPSPNGSHGEQS